jgi:hypothetical protein
MTHFLATGLLARVWADPFQYAFGLVILILAARWVVDVIKNG